MKYAVGMLAFSAGMVTATVLVVGGFIGGAVMVLMTEDRRDEDRRRPRRPGEYVPYRPGTAPRGPGTPPMPSEEVTSDGG